MELLQVKIGARIEALLNNRPAICNSECDATYLGHLLRKLTENKISYSASVAKIQDYAQPPSHFFTVSFEGLSPTSIVSMVNSWKPGLPGASCGGPYSRGCLNKAKPFGEDASNEAQNLPASPQDSEISS